MSQKAGAMKREQVKISTRFRMADIPAALEIITMPDSSTVILPINSRVRVVKGDKVVKGEALCEKAHYGMFAPFEGTVVSTRKIKWDVSGYRLAVDLAKKTDAAEKPLQRTLQDLHSLDGDTLREYGEKLGVMLPEQNRPCAVMLIDEDIPGVANRWLCEKEPDKIIEGLILLKQIVSEKNLFILLSETCSEEQSNKYSEYGTVISVKNSYPDVLSDLQIRHNSVLKKMKHITLIDARRLTVLSAAFSNGHPPFTTLVAFRYGRKGKVRLLQVPIGMRIETLLAQTGCLIRDRDQIIVGGEFNGTALCDVLRPITADDAILQIFPSGEAISTENTPCVRCGRCVSVCPAGLRVDTISTCMELRRIDDAAALGVEQCVGCGICSVVCCVSRPLAHLMVGGKRTASEKNQRTGG